MFFLVFVISELPDKPPEVHVERNRYEAGDILRGNCSSQPSRPRVELTPSINNIVVSTILFHFYSNNNNY